MRPFLLHLKRWGLFTAKSLPHVPRRHVLMSRIFWDVYRRSSHMRGSTLTSSTISSRWFIVCVTSHGLAHPILFQFKDISIQNSLLSHLDTNEVISNSLKEIHAIHRNVKLVPSFPFQFTMYFAPHHFSKMIHNLISQCQSNLQNVTLSSIGCILETALTLMVLSHSHFRPHSLFLSLSLTFSLFLSLSLSFSLSLSLSFLLPSL
jgi:hypothetical protein